MFKIITKHFKTCRTCKSELICYYSTAGQGNTKSSDKCDAVAPTDSNTPIVSDYKPSEVTKEDMQWRKQWHENQGQYYRFLRTFYSEENNVSFMKFMQTPLSFTEIKNWWLRKKDYQEAYMQQYMPERNQMLGDELAAAHFIVYRGGAVKFFHEDKWIKADSYGNYALPPHYQKDKVLQAIDCTDVPLHYEGLANFRGLKRLEWLSLNGCKNMDDWCMDRISNICSSTLIYLDLRNCPQITERGLGALYKMSALKILCLDDKLQTSSHEMTCLLLQDLNPHLDIRYE